MAFPPPPAVHLGDWWAASPFYEAVKFIFFLLFKSRLGFILQVDKESQKGKMHRWSEIQTTRTWFENTLISILWNINPNGVCLSSKKIFFNWMLWGKSLPTIHWCMAEHFIFAAVVAGITIIPPTSPSINTGCLAKPRHFPDFIRANGTIGILFVSHCAAYYHMEILFKIELLFFC